MFYHYYTLQKVILKTTETQVEREEEEAEAEKEVEKKNDNEDNSSEYDGEDNENFKEKNHNPYADFLNTIGDGDEVSCDGIIVWLIGLFLGRRGDRLRADGWPQVLAGVCRIHDGHR